MKKILSLAFMCCLLTVSIYSAWVDNLPGQITQPDGTTIDVLFSGDEFHVWAHDKNGFTMIQDETTGFWCWAIAQNGELVSTGTPIHQKTTTEMKIQPKQNILPERHTEKRNSFISKNRGNVKRFPTIGVVNNLVVFIRFSDDEEFTTPLSYYDAMFNTIGENVDSMNQYFWDASYEQLKVNSHFFPLPNEDFIVSYQDSNPRAFYQPYHYVTNRIGYREGNNGWERTVREHELLANALYFIQHQVPSDIELDSNDDGHIDNICFVIRGGTQAWSELLWPHKWSLWTHYPLEINGKFAYEYNFNIENHMNYSGVRVLAHEFTHTMGSPDYYRYGFSGEPVGIWDLMASSMNPTQSMAAHIKWKYMNWIPPIPTITTSGDYELFPLTTSQTQSAFRVNSTNPNEYYIVEYRSNQTGYIDSGLPGSGLLIYRVDPSINGNADGPPDEMYIYRPNGTMDQGGQIDRAFFSLESGRITINSSSNPTPFLSSGMQGGLNITNIGFAGESITFTVHIGGQAILATPTNITSRLNGFFVTLNWQSPNSDVLSYNIYRDGTLLDNTAELTFTTDDEVFGFFTYNVTAVYEDGESAPVTIDVMQGYINTFPYVQDFSTIPENWTRAIGLLQMNTNLESYLDTNWGSLGYWSNVWMISHYTNDTLHPNGNGALIKLNADNRAWLITPEIELKSTTEEYKLTFDMAHVSYYSADFKQGVASMDDRFAVVILPADASNWSSNHILAQWDNKGSNLILNDIPYHGTNAELTIKGYSGKIKIAFYGESEIENTDSYIHIDNVTITSQGNSDKDILADVPSVVLHGNYPNPFNPTTNIQFALTLADGNQKIQIEIFNIKGQKIRALVDGYFPAGKHSVVWNGQSDNGAAVGSGIYFYRLTSGEVSLTRKMILLK